MCARNVRTYKEEIYCVWYKTGRQTEDSRNEVVFSIIFPTMSSQEELIVKSEVDLKQQRESLNYVMHFLMELIKLRAICNAIIPFHLGRK